MDGSTISKIFFLLPSLLYMGRCKSKRCLQLLVDTNPQILCIFDQHDLSNLIHPLTLESCQTTRTPRPLAFVCAACGHQSFHFASSACIIHHYWCLLCYAASRKHFLGIRCSSVHASRVPHFAWTVSITSRPGTAVPETGATSLRGLHCPILKPASDCHFATGGDITAAMPPTSWNCHARTDGILFS